MKSPKRLHDWWFGELPSAEETPGLVFFRMGTPPFLSRVAKRIRSAPFRSLLAAAGVGLVGWAVFVAMKALTGLG